MYWKIHWNQKSHHNARLFPLLFMYKIPVQLSNINVLKFVFSANDSLNVYKEIPVRYISLSLRLDSFWGGCMASVSSHQWRIKCTQESERTASGVVWRDEANFPHSYVSLDFTFIFTNFRSLRTQTHTPRGANKTPLCRAHWPIHFPVFG